MSHVVRLESSVHTCDWCEDTAKWKKIIKGDDKIPYGGGIYMRACEQHKSLLDEVQHRKKMGK